ncbi:hypothetical protein JZ751_008814 [Albula glossodonta]|uniref:XLR/SYCP3/FAM9 domain-containing protein n=1 Tax=Albula glossodonta TaxID=121402 RepID=A0A8T2P1T2_9TELE|nr:hypothetical protein JZ751_008814 [Albula glossodonta]
MASAGRKQTKKAKNTHTSSDLQAYEFTIDDEKKGLSGSEDDVREADISKALQAKRKRLEAYTKSSLKGSNQKLEQLWKTQQGQRQKLTQEYSQQVFSVLQQWESDVQKSEEQEEKLNNLFRQQQKLFQQARVVQSQKLKTIKQMYEQFAKNMEEMEKSHESFLMGAQSELRKEMGLLQKKIMMDSQQQEMATVRKSLHSMLF